MAQHNELGKLGEEMAVDFLSKNGYKIVQRNYRYLKAEIDIIAKKDNTLIAVEVKTRSSDYFENPQDAVNPKKIKLLVSAMDNFVTENDLDVEVRFDIVSILKQKNDFNIEHIEDAFLFF